MFNQLVLLVSVCSVTVFAFPIPVEGEAKEFFEFFPAEVLTFLSSLSEQDTQLLDEMKTQLIGKSPDNALELVRSKSPDLANRMTTMRESLMAKINNFSEIPRNFAINAMHKMQGVDQSDRVATFKAALEIYDAGTKLPQEAKDEMFRAFPSAKAFFNSEKIKNFFEENKNNSPEEIANQLARQMPF